MRRLPSPLQSRQRVRRRGSPHDGAACPRAVRRARQRRARGTTCGRTIPEIETEYFFTDTGKELPEVYEFLGRLEGFLGKPMIRLNPDRDFDFWLAQYKNFLPSPKTRWCTRQLKIRPFEQWLRPALARANKVTSYVAIRADEDYREGYTSTHANLKVRLPFREIGHRQGRRHRDLGGVRCRVAGLLSLAFPQRLHFLLLSAEDRMGAADGRASRRSSSRPRRYEKNAVEHGSPFTWSQGEIAHGDGASPERIAEIRADHERRLERLRNRVQDKPLARRPGDDGHRRNLWTGEGVHCVPQVTRSPFQGASDSSHTCSSGEVACSASSESVVVRSIIVFLLGISADFQSRFLRKPLNAS